MAAASPAAEALKAGIPALKKVDAPAERKLPTAEEIAAAKALAEKEPEPVPVELLPKTGDGKTHLELIKEGTASLKKVDAPAERKLPTAEDIAAAKALAEKEPEPVPAELLPKTGDGKTHLELIKEGGATLKKVDGPAPKPLPTAEQIAEEKRLSESP
jgi:broad specificity phosphatase PhoE